MSDGADTPLAHAGALLALLEQEHEALRGNDPDRLFALCRDKMLRLRRLDILKTSLPRLDAAQRQQLQELVGRCQAQTTANEALLDARSRRTHAALQMRQGVPGRYDTSGRGQYEMQRNFRVTA